MIAMNYTDNFRKTSVLLLMLHMLILYPLLNRLKGIRDVSIDMLMLVRAMLARLLFFVRKEENSSTDLR